MINRYRTFIAVDVEPFTRDRMCGVQEQLARVVRGVKWVEPGNMHLTLLFLGEIDARDVPRVCKAVERVCNATVPFSFSVAGVGAFPHLRRPRVLIARVDDGVEQLKALHAALEPAIEELGAYRREERAFTPHVTLGRVQRDPDGEELSAALAKFAAWQGGATEVREVRVLSSELTPDGPMYATLARARLRG